MQTNPNINLTMLCDFYELTMANGYFKSGMQDKITYFDLFFRKVPDEGGFAIAAGLEQAIEYIQNLHFGEDDIAYLRYARHLRRGFLGLPEKLPLHGRHLGGAGGHADFPEGADSDRARARHSRRSWSKRFLLLTLNHQSLIATKANRVCRAAKGRVVLEFGSRRAQGSDAAILGARAAYIGGCAGTACTLTDQLYGVPAGGTMAHSWVQMFPSQYEAFKTYCEIYPDNPTLLVDTYNTLQSGIPDAIRAFNEVLKPRGLTKCGIRLDSGDMTYLTKKARQMLDDAGWESCTISCSNALDEYLIRDLLVAGRAELTSSAWASGSSPHVPSRSSAASTSSRPWKTRTGMSFPKIKVSENVGKITNPHFKKLYRFFGNDTGKAIADYLCVFDETVDDTKDIEIFDPEATWKRKTVYNFKAKELMVPIFKNGELVYKLPTLPEIKAYCQQQIDTLWDEVKRFDNPHTYYVDLSQKLWQIKYDLLREKTF